MDPAERLEMIRELIDSTQEQPGTVDVDLAREHDQLLTEIYQLAEVD